MARNKEKLAFGIYKDGLKVKIAQLSLHNGMVFVQSLAETMLSSALFRQEVEDKEEVVLPFEQEEELQELSEIEDEAFSLPEVNTDRICLLLFQLVRYRSPKIQWPGHCCVGGPALSGLDDYSIRRYQELLSGSGTNPAAHPKVHGFLLPVVVKQLRNVL